jgi:hypothetical protein
VITAADYATERSFIMNVPHRMLLGGRRTDSGGSAARTRTALKAGPGDLVIARLRVAPVTFLKRHFKTGIRQMRKLDIIELATSRSKGEEG